MKDSPLSQLGQRLASLPASQATVERVFSSATFQREGRETMSSESLAKEVYIRVNSLQLPYHP